MAFNITLERMSVAGETPRAWFGWGVRALLVALVDLQVRLRVALVVGAWIALAARSCPAFDRLAARLDKQVGRLARRLRLWDPDTYGAIAFASALVFLVIVLSRSLDPGVGGDDDRLEHDRRTARRALRREPVLRRDLRVTRRARRITTTGWPSRRSIWLGVLASWRLVRLRRQQQTTYSTALLTALVGVVVLAVIMWVAPWRLVMQSERPVLLFDGSRCYDLGRERTQLLLYCPDGIAAHPARRRPGSPASRYRDHRESCSPTR